MHVSFSTKDAVHELFQAFQVQHPVGGWRTEAVGSVCDESSRNRGLWLGRQKEGRISMPFGLTSPVGSTCGHVPAPFCRG